MSHLEALAFSDDLEAQKRHAVIVSWITQFMDHNNGIMARLQTERKAMLEQQNTEAGPNGGSPWMEADSGTFDVAE